MKKRSAFTIVEMMITLTIFSIVSATAMTVLYNSMRSAKNVQAQLFLYTEAQALMDQIGRSVERNTIDYEAYYLREVHGEPGWDSRSYGYYGQTFVDPGSDGPDSDGPYTGVSGYGTYCAGSTSLVFPAECTVAIADSNTADEDEGVHPYDPSLGHVNEWNAFCEDDSTCPDLENQIMDELILVNADGDERIIFALEDFDGLGDSTDHYLSKVELVGSDTDGDGVEDQWECNSRYSCTGLNGSITVPKATDLLTETAPESATGEQSDFMPISPSNISISNFYVILAPIEDPYQAFDEPEMQVQPHVTIVMTVSLSDDYSNKLLGNPPSITFQRTVSAGVYSEVISYE